MYESVYNLQLITLIFFFFLEWLRWEHYRYYDTTSSVPKLIYSTIIGATYHT